MPGNYISAEDYADKLNVNSKYTEQRVALILGSLRNGNPRFVAAAAAGIIPRTFRTWLKEKPEFAAAVLEAEASAVAAHVGIINKAAREGDWRASRFWLERRYPEEFGSVSRVEIIQRQRQAEAIAEELSAELGRRVTVEEVLAEANLARPALPSPQPRKRRKNPNPVT